MHIYQGSSDTSILIGDRSNLAKVLLARLDLNNWPFKIRDLPAGSALVGGSIRDALLDRLSDRPDLDLIVPSEAIDITKQLAINLGAKFVPLDSERDIARLVLDGWTVDFASQIGNSLEEDLWNRDYRINAIALRFGEEPTIVDPTNGIQDLVDRRLLAVRRQNLLDDPLRLLRGLRFKAELDFSIDDATRTFIKTYSKLLLNVAHERIQSEISRIVVAGFWDEVISLLKEIDLLAPWSNSDEKLDKQDIPIKASGVFEKNELDLALPLARLTSLLSDQGLQELKFSRRQCQRCRVLRKWQEVNDGSAFKSLNEADRLLLHQELEEDLPALIIGLQLRDQEIWIKRWRDPKDPLFHPSSPLDGHTLKHSLGIPEGPYLGELLRSLCHERAFGRLATKDEALQFARKLLNHKNTFCD